METKESYTFEELKEIIATLRSEHGCPWDKAQTHESMKKCLQDECDEVLEAIDRKDTENLCEELGMCFCRSCFTAGSRRKPGSLRWKRSSQSCAGS